MGIAIAANEWVALTDAGVRLEPTWLERLVEAASGKTNVAVVYGNYEPVTDSFFERCAALSYTAPKRQRPGGLMRGPSIASALIRREVWETVGGFPDLRATEDLIFMERVEEGRFNVAWAPRATVWWHLEPTLRSTFRKFVSYSRSAARAGRQRHWHYGVAKQYLLGLPFIALALLHSPWWLLVPLAGFAARAAKSIWERREGRGATWLLNPAQFLGVALVLLTLDLATFVGWWQSLMGPREKVEKPQPSADQADHTR